MTHHTHSHSAEQPAQTDGALIRWAPYYDFTVNIITLGHAGLLRKMTVDNALIKPGDYACWMWVAVPAKSTLLAKTRAQGVQSLWH